MARGVARRAELAPEARRLRAEGLTFREIGERLGVGLRTAHEWCSDPDRAKYRARRQRYAGTCVDCGARTDGSDGPGRAAKRCAECTRRHQKENGPWPRERVIEAIRAWAERYGAPPAAPDWNPAQARWFGHPEKVERFRGGEWPSTTTVAKRFGSWAAGIEAAGFPRPRPGVRPSDAGMDLCMEIRLRYEGGESAYALAREYGCHSNTIAYRIRKAGGQMRSPREAWSVPRERQAA